MERIIEVVRKNGKRVLIPLREIRWVQEEDEGTFIELLGKAGFSIEESYDVFINRLSSVTNRT